MTHAGQKSAPRIGIVGDDLTGVAAVAGAFAHHGYTCRMGVDLATRFTDSGVCQCLGLVTDSRHSPPDKAAESVSAAAAILREAGCTIYFKKVDSLLRGQVAVELKALSDALARRPILFVAAAPASGRVTHAGTQIPLRQASGGAADAGSYIRSKPPEPHIPSLLFSVWNTSIDVIPLETATEPATLRQRLTAVKRGIVVVDADMPDHLPVIARAGLEAGFSAFAGTSEFAAAVALALREKQRQQVLLVAGSASRTIEAQCARLEAGGLARIARLGDAGAKTGSSLARLALEYAATFPAIAIAAPNDAFDAEHSPAIAKILGEAAVELVHGGNVSCVIATGGDTAAALLQEAGARILEPHRLLSQGVPLCTVRGGAFDGLRIVTKPGAYGDADCLVDLVRSSARHDDIALPDTESMPAGIG